MIPDSEAVYTTREAAQMLGVSLRTIQQWVELGALQAFKTVGGHRRIARHSVEEMLQARVKALGAGQLKVLIAEDDSDLLELYRVRLSSLPLPLEVITASDGIQALLLIGELQPDVIILDLQMPLLDGKEVIRRLRADTAVKTPELIVVTGLDQDQLAQHQTLLHGLMVLPKPVPFAQLEIHLTKRCRERK